MSAAPGAGGAARTPSQSIGAILVEAGRLKPEHADRIVRVQREQGLRFGDAALRLGLLTQADIDFALSRQFQFPYLIRGEATVSETVIAAYAPVAPQVEALRALRAQLRLRGFDAEGERRALAVVSAERGEGRSYITANLAVVFSQLGERTIVVDADMRNPSQHRLFGVENRAGLSALLAGRAGLEVIGRVPSLLDLSVLPAGAVPPNPSELLARPAFGKLLEQLASEYAIILLDTPAASQYADAMVISLRAGAALIVVRRNASRAWRVRGVADGAAQGNVMLVGTVLNDY